MGEPPRPPPPRATARAASKTVFVGGAAAGDGELGVDRADAVLTVFTGGDSFTDSDAAIRQGPGRTRYIHGQVKAEDNPGRR